MTTEDFSIDRCCRIDDQMQDVPQHSQAHRWPSEAVTVGVLLGWQGGGERALYRWLGRDDHPRLPRGPERSRRLRRLRPHPAWT